MKFKEYKVIKGFYNGTKVAFIENNWSLWGSTDDNYEKGESSYGKPFEEKYSNNLFHFTGALSMYTTEKEKSFDSRFIIVGDKSVSEKTIESMGGYRIWPEKVINKYKTDGGVPSLDFSIYTVFGQVVNSDDVISNIMKTDTNLENSSPVEDIVINSIKILE